LLPQAEVERSDRTNAFWSEQERLDPAPKPTQECVCGYQRRIILPLRALAYRRRESGAEATTYTGAPASAAWHGIALSNVNPGLTPRG